jgi:hypothetical protein
VDVDWNTDRTRRYVGPIGLGAIEAGWLSFAGICSDRWGSGCWDEYGARFFD